MIIELAVFADDAMWRHFYRMYNIHADVELHKFIMAAVNNVGFKVILSISHRLTFCTLSARSSLKSRSRWSATRF